MKTKRKPESLRVSSGGRRLSGWRARVHEGVRNSVSALSCLLIAVQPVLAQNVVPTTNGPEVIEAPNGVGIVNIQTPNAQGLSQNSYDDFNVGADGLILNNINGNFGQTQLGGVIAGNANLQDGSASIILNEVVGGNPSSLGGYLEVAGTRADVIVANPYGMTCDGCGFLNTDRLTLTTGTPIYEGSQFTGVSVDDGTIAVGEGGLDASDTTRFDLISRQITVAGSVQGQRIHVIAGRNDVIYATGEIREKADDGSTSPDLAIDSTVFGGMYAGAITITSTEDGVGVRAPTEMAASTGQMTLTADGRLVMGRASSEGAVSVTTTTGSVQVEQSLTSNDSLTITSAQDLIVDADGKIVAQAAAVFDIARDINLGARAELVSADSISATMGRNMLMAQGAQVLSYGDIAVTAQEIEAGQDTQFMAGAAGGDGDTSTANLTLSAADRLTLWGGTAASGGSIDVVTRVLDIAAQGGLPAGSFVATTDARFTLTRLEALDGVLQAGQMLSLENAGGILTVNGGILQSGDALLLSGQGLDFGATAQSLNGTVTALATAGDLFVDGTLIGQLVDITASDSLNVSGTVEAANMADLNAAVIENTGTLRATDLRLDAAQITNDGTAYAAQTLDIVASGAVTNSGNVVSDGWLRVAGGNPALVNAEGAEITAADDAVFTLARFDNAGAVASTDGRVLITSAGDVTNAQTAVIYGEMLLQILSDGTILNDGGALLAQEDMVIGGASGDVDARAASFTNQNGGLVETFAGDIEIAASVFENLRPDPLITDAVDTDEEESFSGDCSGLLGTYRCVTTTVTTTVTTQTAEMVGEPGMILSGGDLTLAVDSARNAYSLISTAGNIELTAGTLENIGLDLTETTEVERSVVTRERFCFLFCGGTSTTTAVSNDAPIVEEAGAVFASIEAGGSIVGNVSGYLQNGAYGVGAIPTTSGVGAPGLSGTDPGSVNLTPLGSDISGITAGSIGNPALVVTNVDPDASYLV
ncbi:filamentous hemagglutinin N-terminal domain-containing protein, partial [Octadecabacter sp. G9-8]